MSTPPISYSGPVIDSSVPWETRRHLQLIYQKLGNHTQAFSLQQQSISSIKAGTSTTTFISGGSGGSTSGSVTGIAVNNLIGQTSYSTLDGENNALLVFSSVSPIAVTLNTQTPPWSCFIANIGALGDGTVTLTPFSGTINGAATLDILPTYEALVCFDGTNWFAASLPIVPLTFSAISHQFLTAYNAATGVFTAAQPAFTDISGIAQVSQGGTGTSSPGLIAGTNVTITGSWPNQTINATTTGLSVTIVTAALTVGGTQGSMVFTNGLLTSQVQAT